VTHFSSSLTYKHFHCFSSVWIRDLLGNDLYFPLDRTGRRITPPLSFFHFCSPPKNYPLDAPLIVNAVPRRRPFRERGSQTFSCWPPPFMFLGFRPLLFLTWSAVNVSWKEPQPMKDSQDRPFLLLPFSPPIVDGQVPRPLPTKPVRKKPTNTSQRPQIQRFSRYGAMVLFFYFPQTCHSFPSPKPLRLNPGPLAEVTFLGRVCSLIGGPLMDAWLAGLCDIQRDLSAPLDSLSKGGP